MKVTIGRIVHYVLTADDTAKISRRRTTGSSIAERLAQSPPAWPAGAQAHIGNPVSAGEHVPMVVCLVWSIDGVNGQVFLDGNDSLWVTSVKEGTEPGTWHWPEREA